MVAANAAVGSWTNYTWTDVRDETSSFRWLFQVLKKAHNAAQGVVEILVKDKTVLESLLDAGLSIYNPAHSDTDVCRVGWKCRRC